MAAPSLSLSLSLLSFSPLLHTCSSWASYSARLTSSSARVWMGGGGEPSDMACGKKEGSRRDDRKGGRAVCVCRRQVALNAVQGARLWGRCECVSAGGRELPVKPRPAVRACERKNGERVSQKGAPRPSFTILVGRSGPPFVFFCCPDFRHPAGGPSPAHAHPHGRHRGSGGRQPRPAGRGTDAARWRAHCPDVVATFASGRAPPAPTPTNQLGRPRRARPQLSRPGRQGRGRADPEIVGSEAPRPVLAPPAPHLVLPYLSRSLSSRAQRRPPPTPPSGRPRPGGGGDRRHPRLLLPPSTQKRAAARPRRRPRRTRRRAGSRLNRKQSGRTTRGMTTSSSTIPITRAGGGTRTRRRRGCRRGAGRPRRRAC